MKRHIAYSLALLGLCGPVSADTIRPKARPFAPEIVARATHDVFETAAPARSLRPVLRRAGLSDLAQVKGTQAGFAAWKRSFRPRALRAGISAAVFDRAFAGVRFDPSVVAKDSKQSEFTKAIWEYLDSAASDTRVATGREMMFRHGRLLRQIEERYGVDRQIVLAVWGMESNFGSYRGTSPVIQSMASLAYDGRRQKFFEGELIAALKILQGGHTTPENMKGSWAGAMGHTQFMPSSFNALAVDYTGDGRRDIWGDDPADALASTAHYLAKSGWITGMPWGVEVRLSDRFDYALAGGTKKMPSDWARLGLRDMQGRAVRDYGAARVFLPAGHKGPAFLVFKNFDVIKRYNAADAYAMGVGHLGDRILGAPRFVAHWPRDDRALSYAERKELQRRLTAAGYGTGGIDGRLGPKSTAALRRWQQARGLVPDGFASFEALRRLR